MFELKQTSGKARIGKLSLNHGEVNTPIFMPVGTVGCVKALVPTDLIDIKAEIILGNTYHLFLRPGLEVIKKFGGLHNFIKWDKPMLSDSGGFQVFSLGNLKKIDETGVKFKSHIDGSLFDLTPEFAVEIQETLGTDIHMVLDECTPFPASYEEARLSMERSMRWAKRCRGVKKRIELAQFGIVQGGIYEDLRIKSCNQLVDLNFEGYSIGGLSVGEPKPEMRMMTELCCNQLPDNKPRYLMGVGTPLDIVESVGLGVDMFDCVMPTRNARNGTLFTSIGKVNIKNSQNRFSEDSLDTNCECYTCRTFSRSYLHHLYKAKELTSHRLLSLHNLTYYLQLIKDIRKNILNDTYEEFIKIHQNLWEK